MDRHSVADHFGVTQEQFLPHHLASETSLSQKFIWTQTLYPRSPIQPFRAPLQQPINFFRSPVGCQFGPGRVLAKRVTHAFGGVLP